MSSEILAAGKPAGRRAQNLNADAQAQWSHDAFKESLRAVTEAAHGHRQEQHIHSLIDSLRCLCQQLFSAAFAHVQQSITWGGAGHRDEYAQFVEPLRAQCSDIHAQLGTVYAKLFGLFLGNDDGLFALGDVWECICAAEDDQRRCATAALRDIGAVESVVVMDPDVLRQLSGNCEVSAPAMDSDGGPNDEGPGDLGLEWSP